MTWFLGRQKGSPEREVRGQSESGTRRKEGGRTRREWRLFGGEIQGVLCWGHNLSVSEGSSFGLTILVSFLDVDHKTGFLSVQTYEITRNIEKVPSWKDN